MGEMTATQTFQENIKERLRADIGDLVPDDVLAQLVEQAIKDMFFTVGHRSAGGQDYSWFQKEVEEQLRTRVAGFIELYFRKNAEVLQGVIADTVTDAMPDMFAIVMTNALSGMGSTIGVNLGQIISDGIRSSVPTQY